MNVPKTHVISVSYIRIPGRPARPRRSIDPGLGIDNYTGNGPGLETGSRERIATVQVGVPSLLCIEAQWRARLNYVDSLFVKRCGGVATHEKFCDSGASCVTFEVSNIRVHKVLSDAY